MEYPFPGFELEGKIWWFPFHQTPDMPEALVEGKETRANCPSGHSDNFCVGWEAAASSGGHVQNSIPLAYATHGKYYLDGFNEGREKVLFGDDAHGEDDFCDVSSNRESSDTGTFLPSQKACDEWTKGYDTAYNVTCVFTPSWINDNCNGANQTSFVEHTAAYIFGFEHGKKYPAGWMGDPMDCSKKYSYGGFGGKDSILLKN
ncbi:MAG: hypothetical protein WAK17_06230 [Candidatus Nitrosopolaris sp.]|jgi:hypothetical protein